MIELVASLVDDHAVAVEDGEAAAAAVQVALVGGGKQFVVDPRHAIRLAQHGGEGVLLEHAVGALVQGVDAIKVDGAGGEVGDHLRGREIDDGDVVVLLQGHHRFVAAVDVDVFGLRIVRIGHAGQFEFDVGARPGSGRSGQRQNDQITSGQLRGCAVAG